jgi:hypothetical protein
MLEAYASGIVTKGTRVAPEHDRTGSTERSHEHGAGPFSPPLEAEIVSDIDPPAASFGVYPHDRFLAALNRQMSARDYARDVLRYAGLRSDADASATRGQLPDAGHG